jgi:hypothetical protein
MTFLVGQFKSYDVIMDAQCSIWTYNFWIYLLTRIVDIPVLLQVAWHWYVLLTTIKPLYKIKPLPNKCICCFRLVLSLRGEVCVNKSNLTLPLFYWSVCNKPGKLAVIYLCVRSIDFASISMILQSNIGTVST